MKNLIYLIALLLALIIMTASCEKESDIEGGRMRITKMAESESMNNATLFEYDSNNLLVNISWEYAGYSHDVVVKYNTDKQPVEVTETIDNHRYTPETSVTEIQWTNDGFILVGEEHDEKNSFELDTQGRITKKIESFTDANSYETLTYEDIFQWNGDESLKVNEYRFTFNKYNHPFSGINIAVILAAEIEIGEWENEWQNKYCISDYKENYLSAKINYTVNEQNYPTMMDIQYDSDEGSYHEFRYFEYESY
jgi:hypothetical protein